MYEPLVDFLADYLGEHAEVVLHDLTDLEHSVVKIRNGHVSGRREGDPCTDFVMRVLKQIPEGKRYQCNYLSTDRNGRALKSGSYYIQDPNGRLVGMLCVNVEADSYLKARAYLDRFFCLTPECNTVAPDSHISENFGQSIGEMIDAALSRAIAGYDCEVDRLTYAEKEQIIESINGEGIFLLKGAVSKTAAALGISEPTVYRYLSRLKK